MSENATMWYYAKSNQQYGPVTAEVVRDMLASGQLRPGDLVWTTGMAEWKEAHTVEELVPPLQPAPVSEPPDPPPPPWGEPHRHQPQPPPPPSWGGAPPPPSGPAGQYGPVGYQPAGPGRSQQGMAVGAFVCSIFSILCAPLGVGLVAGVIAVILASTATSNMARTDNYEGRGLAKAGFVMGIVGICLSTLVCGVRII